MGVLLDQIPGLTEAVAAAKRSEALRRDAAWLDLPLEICGVAVRPFTPRHGLALTIAASPFLVGGRIKGEDIGVFLWAVSPQYCMDKPELRAAFMDFAARTLNYRATVEGIRGYLDEALADRLPPGAGGADEITSFAAALIHDLACEYGWKADEILDMPFARLMQLQRWIARSRNPKLPLFNAADRVRSKFVREYLAKQRRERPAKKAKKAKKGGRP